MIKILSRLCSLLTKKERYFFVGAIVISGLAGIVQIGSVGSIIPFMTYLLKPELLNTSTALNYIYEVGGFANERSFQLGLGGLVLFALILGNAFSALNAWYLIYFSWKFQVRVSTDLFLENIKKPYASFLNRNSADIAKNILTESSQVAQGVLLPLSKILTNSLIALLIFLFLAWLDPVITISVVLLFGIAYLLIYLMVRRPLLRIGERRFEVNKRRFETVNQAFGSIKEVKLLNREVEFALAYHHPAKILGRSVTFYSVLSLLPRYIIETIAFGALILSLIIMLYRNIEMTDILPLASGFALAGYRILPALQAIYSSLNALRFNAPVLGAIERDLEADPVSPMERTSPLPFERCICLNNVSYRYPNADKPSITEINIEIPSKGFIAFVGSTGAGKTTIVDLILGLLSPTEGALIVDDCLIDRSNVANWQANIGYVPQEIFLLDDTIAANIAFGQGVAELDMDAVQRAAKMANIHEFIEENLSNGYETTVGERGVRLSGGERQRIGLARALYQDPSVLVLDEATSALDSTTEQKIHQTIIETAASKTVIVIAHRISTVVHCDCIYLMDKGRILESGSYHDLLSKSPEFRNLANASNT